jgi:hypothetical protein
MNTDLLRSFPRWNDVMGELRSHCAALRAEGIAPEAVNAWALHWDYQLYKGNGRVSFYY